MDFNSTIDIILKDLKDIREIIDDLKNYPGIPKLQVELARSKCKSAEEIIALLKTVRHDSQTQSGDLSAQPAQPAEPAQPEKKIHSNIIADKFAGSTGTIHDKFGSLVKDEDLSSSLRNRPVNDLADAIGLNDKFLFIREIFGGDKEGYEQALGKLNRAENIDDARAIIMSYTGESEENDVTKQLLEIVKRKLTADG